MDITVVCAYDIMMPAGRAALPAAAGRIQLGLL